MLGRCEVELHCLSCVLGRPWHPVMEGMELLFLVHCLHLMWPKFGLGTHQQDGALVLA
jgi:hypothetical protein